MAEKIPKSADWALYNGAEYSNNAIPSKIEFSPNGRKG
jgi:hypothetical protein